MLDFMRIRLKDVLMVLAAALLMMPAICLAERNMALAVFVVFFIASLLTILSRRVSVVIAAVTLSGLLGFTLKYLVRVPVNSTAMCVLVIAVIFFELFDVLAKENEAGIAVSAGLSSSLVPLLAYFVMGINVRENAAALAANGVDYLVIGIGAALAALAIWHVIRHSKAVLMFVFER